MTSDLSLLFNIQLLSISYLVSFPDGDKVKVTRVGSLTLFLDLILTNVLYIPSFQYNLISMYKLVEQPSFMIQFTNLVAHYSPFF